VVSIADFTRLTENAEANVELPCDRPHEEREEEPRKEVESESSVVVGGGGIGGRNTRLRVKSHTKREIEEAVHAERSGGKGRTLLVTPVSRDEHADTPNNRHLADHHGQSCDTAETVDVEAHEHGGCRQREEACHEH
jgi:hypothetical protein